MRTEFFSICYAKKVAGETMADDLFYGLVNRQRTVDSNFLATYIFCRKWCEPILEYGSMNFLAELSKRFLESFWSEITTKLGESPQIVKPYVSQMITEDGVLSIQEKYPKTPYLEVYYIAFWKVFDEMKKSDDIKDKIPHILNNIFKYFIPDTFVSDEKGNRVYTAFNMHIFSEEIHFVFYMFKDVMDGPIDKVEDHFDFSFVLKPDPHLKINQRVSNIRGNAQMMGTQIISIFNSFDILKYIETDTVNPITYHISAKQGFKPVCAVDWKKECMSSRDDILQKIHKEYTEIITGSDGSLSDDKKARIEDLFNKVKDPDDEDFRGVKMRLYKHKNSESKTGVYKRRSSVYYTGVNELWGGAQSRSSTSPGSAMALLTGFAWLLFASLLGSGPHRDFLP